MDAGQLQQICTTNLHNKFAQTGRLEKLPTQQIGASQIAVPAAPAGAHASPKAGAAAVSGAHLDADPDHAHHERP